jgi:hypothetical protein
MSTPYTPPSRGQVTPGERKRSGMGPCCAQCKTPYGHSAEAGICCHTTATTRSILDEAAELTRQNEQRSPR